MASMRHFQCVPTTYVVEKYEKTYLPDIHFLSGGMQCLCTGYCIRSNYRTVPLGFSKLLKKHVVK